MECFVNPTYSSSSTTLSLAASPSPHQNHDPIFKKKMEDAVLRQRKLYVFLDGVISEEEPPRRRVSSVYGIRISDQPTSSRSCSPPPIKILTTSPPNPRS
ncbi:CSC1-like protein isoform X2 [Iris pallida]|uniref:CSC1-like protein isoform X2 n=1 Tax=Iris pallida TaxID=29817 RepID=A0AAX6F7C2_IRIPA|nr:CSC1-like protein isoform X2 [Iris pallida]